MADHSRNPAAAAVGRGPGYEVRDTNVRAVVTFLVALTIFVALVQVLLWGMLNLMSSEARTSAPATLTIPPMIPDQLRELRAAENAALGVTPAKAGAAPAAPSKIEAAIDQIAERGLPVMKSDRTEVEVNSHSGKPAADKAPAAPKAEPGKGQESPK